MKSKLFCSALLAALATVSHAATVSVNGAADVPGTSYQKLSSAIAYVNTQGAGPHTINITVNTLAEDRESVISVPVTINGDGNTDSTPVSITVDQTTLRAQPNIGVAGFNVFEVNTSGNVVVNDIIMFPTTQGSTTTLDPFEFVKPASGVGNYTLNNVKVSGGSVGAYVPVDSSSDGYYATSVMRWYAYLDNSGIYHMSNAGGAGSYNTVLNNCHGGVARSHVIFISNQSGTTTINGGAYGKNSDSIIKIVGGTGITITGSPTNRVLLTRTASSGNSGINECIYMATGTIDTIEYVDSVNHGRAGAASDTSGNTLQLAGAGGVTNPIQYVRTGSIVPVAVRIAGTYAGGPVSFANCTFDQAATGVAPLPATVFYDPVRMDAGTVNFTNCIFTSSNTGQVRNSAGTLNLTNCALPTDGAAGESLNTTNPTFAAPASNVSAVSVSPAYQERTFNFASTANTDYLRPTASAYSGAATGGGPLSGGAGGGIATVGAWYLY